MDNSLSLLTLVGERSHLLGLVRTPQTVFKLLALVFKYGD